MRPTQKKKAGMHFIIIIIILFLIINIKYFIIFHHLRSISGCNCAQEMRRSVETERGQMETTLKVKLKIEIKIWL